MNPPGLEGAAARPRPEPAAWVRAVIDATDDAIVAFDPKGRVILFSAGAERLMGYRARDVLGGSAFQLLSKSDRAEYADHLQRYLETGESRVLGEEREVKGLRSDGSAIPLAVRTTELHFGGERLFIVVARDIRQRKRIEATLRARALQQEASARLSRLALEGASLQEYLKEAASLLASRFEVDFVTAVKLSEDGRELRLMAGVGGEIADLASSSVPADRRSQAGYTLMVGEPVVMEDLLTETRFVPSALQRKYQVRSGLSVVIPGEQRPYGVLSIHSRELRRFSSDEALFLQTVANGVALVLKREAIEQALSASQGQFLQAQKMEAVGRLAGGVAHDFNNLLTAIQGNADLILEAAGDNSAVQEKVDAIQQAADHAAALTGRLLAFSRKQVIQPRLVELGEVVTDTTRMLGRMIGEDIEVETRLEPGLGRTRVDPAQMEQVIMNLAVNARDAMPSGGRLMFRTTGVEFPPEGVPLGLEIPAGRYVVLMVGDTGCGMDAEVRTHLFEPFFTTKERGRGTGLGLSTVYGIVKQSGGDIRVTSSAGHGTSFEIFLPVVEPVTEPAGSPKQPELPGGGVETLLMVEDEDHIRSMLREVLEQFGYQVLEAADGRQALELSEAHSGPINMLVTDVVMPGMSGRELADALTAKRPELSVLYISGYTDDVIAKSGVLEPDVEYLQKPFRPTLLVRRVREILDKARVGAAV